MSWHGRVLRVDLSAGTTRVEALNERWAEQYLGARGLATRYLYDEVDPRTDPLAPEMPLIFATGPLTGTRASTGGRWTVVTKGALTDAIACSNSGGKFGAELKYAGYDLVIITGRSERPVYLSIVDDEVQLIDASPWWGRTVWETEEGIKKSHSDPQVKVASIGVAGEAGVRYACIVNDLHRAAGRSGVGAVMGAKHLKASNFQEVSFEGTSNINPAAMSEVKPNGHVNLLTNKACFGCTIGCGRIAHVDKAHFSVRDRAQYHHASGGLEYETAFALGPVIGVDDIDALTFAGFLMNEHGMDPISFGVTLAAAMELFELGLISTDDTDGVELRFGNAEALVSMAEKTGLHEGFGKLLGLGAKRLCEHYGRPELAMVVKGQEFAGYDGRALQGMGLGYATSNRGACHLKHDVFAQDMADQSGAGKAEPCKSSQDVIAMVDSTGTCLFTMGAWGTAEFGALIRADLGDEWSDERLIDTGERIWNLERLFNLEAGFTAADDTLPPRLLSTPAPSGTAAGRVAEIDRMLPEYYRLRGW